MKKTAGFTLIELMVVIAILGIMAASAVPLYSRYRQITVGSEATVMLKQILDAEIMYFVENEGGQIFILDKNALGQSAEGIGQRAWGRGLMSRST